MQESPTSFGYKEVQIYAGTPYVPKAQTNQSYLCTQGSHIKTLSKMEARNNNNQQPIQTVAQEFAHSITIISKNTCNSAI